MRELRKMLRRLAVIVPVSACLGAAPAHAVEIHNFLAPPFGSFAEIWGVAVDQSNGNVYVADRGSGASGGTVKIFGSEGLAPAGGAPSSIKGGGPRGAFSEERFEPVAMAVDPTSHAVYVEDDGSLKGVLEKYVLDGSGEYVYACDLKYYAADDRCLASGGSESEASPRGAEVGQGRRGVALDSAGDVYAAGRINESTAAIFEFNAAGEGVQMFPLPLPASEGTSYTVSLSVSANGTIYALVYQSETGLSEVVELERSSLTGAEEGEPIAIASTKSEYGAEAGFKWVTFDQATEQLLLVAGTHVVALEDGDEVVSEFGRGIIKVGRSIAVDEASGEVYVANEEEQKVDRFGPGLLAAAPAVNAPPPSVSGVTRTSALVSPTIDPGNATTGWQLEYVPAGEYQPAAGNPYALGGSTGQRTLPAAGTGVSVGPLALTGLSADTTYHYRVVASNELGTTYGPDYTFTTAAATPPVVTTGAASAVTQTGVTLAGTIVTSELQTSYEFEVGTDTSYGGVKLFGNAGASGTEVVSANLQFLIPGVTYHYRLLATNEDGTTYGQDVTFTTPGVPAGVVQPSDSLLLASPQVAFPSTVGAITKPPIAGKKKTKAKRRVRPRRKGGGKAKGTKGKRRKGGAKRG